MVWHVIYDDRTGGDTAACGYLSVASVVADPLPAGLSMKVIPGPPQNEQWNTTTLVWEPIPAPPPDVDRVDEIITAVEAVETLTPRIRNVLRPELESVLGDRRFRDPDEDYEIREGR